MSRIERNQSHAAVNSTEAEEPPNRSVDPEAERRIKDAAAEKRRNEHYAQTQCAKDASVPGGTCSSPDPRMPTDRAGINAKLARLSALERDPSASPEETKALREQAPTLRRALEKLDAAEAARARAAAQATVRAAEKQAAIAAVVHPDAKPADVKSIASEVMRLRVEKAQTNDPEVARAIATRVATLSLQWCEMARAKGMSPPGDAFDPFRATDAELKSAILWTEVGNIYPSSALRDGGARYHNELLLAHAVRSPALLSQLTGARKDDPELLTAFYKELRRLGDTRPCTANDTVASLTIRRAELVRMEANGAEARANEEARQRVTIGVDGRVGKTESIVLDDMEQYLLAANPGSAIGTILAASNAGDVDAMRRAGQAGRLVEGMGGGVGRTKPSDLPKVGHDAPIARP